MNNIDKMKKAKYITDLELYELVVAMYPEKFGAREEAGDDLWDEVMEFVDEDLCGELLTTEQGLRALFGRILLLTNPLQSAISGTMHHALGTIEIADGKVHMLAHAKTEVVIEKAEAAEQRWACWSCKEPVSAAERAAADGECPHCRAELDPKLWPAQTA